MRRFLKRNSFLLGYGLFLALALCTVLLDTFVIPRMESVAVDTAAETAGIAAAGGALLNGASAESSEERAAIDPTALADGQEAGAVVTANGYKDDQVEITIQSLRAYDTAYYVADVKVSDPSFLRTALAENAFGRNLKETTSAMAEENGALLAINGDYYGFRNSGYVLRNGTLYRVRESEADLLLIDRQGDFTVTSAAMFSPDQLASGEWWQVFSFGPILVKDGHAAVLPGQEVDMAKASNPRTAIGQIGEGHYVFLVSDGRTEESAGFSLNQLAEVMSGLGCKTAYNLDGGGSSTMVFMGNVVNNPTSSGKRISEREVSDIVYIGL